ncbi:MAG: hypothetical protein ABJD97_22675, partial [Betaproteobacteria bacterium]
MRTHPLIALAVAAAAITTVAVFGQSAPAAPSAPRHANATLDARPAASPASSAVPAWLAPAPASAALPVARAASAVLRPDASATPRERGRDLAAAGDCAGCHTVAGGAPF